MAHATHLELRQAQAAHPFWLIALGLVLLAVTCLLIDGLFGTHRFQNLRAALRRHQLPIAVGLGLFGLWRLIA